MLNGQSKQTPKPYSTNPPAGGQTVQITTEEKQKIDGWITNNNLNQYGDTKDTAYTGATPLFNEATGERIDRYEYIISKHMDKPWNK